MVCHGVGGSEAGERKSQRPVAAATPRQFGTLRGGLSETVLGPFGGCLGTPWGLFRNFWGPLKTSRGLLGGPPTKSWGHFRPEQLGAFRGAYNWGLFRRGHNFFGPSWAGIVGSVSLGWVLSFKGRLGEPFGHIGRLFSRFESHLGRLETDLALLGRLGTSGGVPSGSFGKSAWRFVGASRKRFEPSES